MKNFKHHLDTNREIGYVEKVFQVLVYVSGLPHVSPNEIVIFENEEIGQVIGLTPEYVEVLLLSGVGVDVGTKVARTKKLLEIEINEGVLGKTLDSLGNAISSDVGVEESSHKEKRYINKPPSGISTRLNIHESFETGVSIVDLLISLGKGQRELVMGDRKSGKTPFLLQTALSAVSSGSICVYAAIAKRQTDIWQIDEYFKNAGVRDKVCLVASGSAEPSSMVYINPYTAMTVAEYFRDSGKNVLIILDDMTTHAKYYREIALLAKRFPGRSSYPGDIFYKHARLMERAGNFRIIGKSGKKLDAKEVSITCLPVAELVMGDVSGYISTNLMAMTDGHIFFDKNLYNEGRRPAINPFLSVTRVGHQAQTSLVRDISRVLSGLMVRIKELEQFMHFGTELSADTKRESLKGQKLMIFFSQTPQETIPININILILAGIWSDRWKEIAVEEFKRAIRQIREKYQKNKEYRDKVDMFVDSLTDFDTLIKNVGTVAELFE